MLKAIARVDGMMCPMCESHTNDAVRGAIAVKSVSSSHKDGLTVVIADEIDEAALKSAIEATGYRVLDIKIESYEKKSLLARLFKK